MSVQKIISALCHMTDRQLHQNAIRFIFSSSMCISRMANGGGGRALRRRYVYKTCWQNVCVEGVRRGMPGIVYEQVCLNLFKGVKNELKIGDYWRGKSIVLARCQDKQAVGGWEGGGV